MASVAERIEAIVAAARRPVPEIRERKGFKHKVTGEVFSPFGMPAQARREDFDVVTTGFVYVSAHEGTTYAPRHFATADEARQSFIAHLDKCDAKFRAELEGMAPAELARQAEYWLETRKAG